jgi:hypothetical protein
MLKILNRILESQVHPTELMSRLDEILKGVNEIRRASADRDLTDQQKQILLSILGHFRGAKVAISAAANDPEAFRYATEFAALFKEAGFELRKYAGGSESTGVNAVMVMGGTPVTGVQLQVSDYDAWQKPVVRAFRQALNLAKIKHAAIYWKNPDDFEVYIGLKPKE